MIHCSGQRGDQVSRVTCENLHGHVTQKGLSPKVPGQGGGGWVMPTSQSPASLAPLDDLAASTHGRQLEMPSPHERESDLSSAGTYSEYQGKVGSRI